MSLRGTGKLYVIARSVATKQSLVLVDTERDDEIAAASRGWPRNDIGKKGGLAMTQSKNVMAGNDMGIEGQHTNMSLRGAQRRSNLSGTRRYEWGR